MNGGAQSEIRGELRRLWHEKHDLLNRRDREKWDLRYSPGQDRHGAEREIDNKYRPLMKELNEKTRALLKTLHVPYADYDLEKIKAEYLPPLVSEIFMGKEVALLPPEQIRVVIISFLKALRDNQRAIIVERFGLITGERLTYREISELNGRTRERARQIYYKAMRRLQHPTRKRQLVEGGPVKVIGGRN